MTKDSKYQLYLLVRELQINLDRLQSLGSTGSLMDDCLDKCNQMMGYFIISGIDNILDEKAEQAKDLCLWRIKIYTIEL